jgi:hypothetical protein
MPLQFRRGTDAQRSAVTPAAGEPLWITDTSKLYIGDGTSTGGIEVSGGGSGGAPTNASYLVLGTHTGLSSERVLVIGTGLASTDAGAGGDLTIALATHTHAASNITSGTLALARGGLAADISTTGGTRQFLKQTSAGGAVSVSAIAATELGTSGTPGTDTYLRGDLTWSTTGGGGGAPTNASYLVLGTNASLDSERVLTIGTGLVATDAGANGNYTIALGSHTHNASDVQAGTLALARGGLAADISTTGPGFLRQTSAGAAVSIAGIAATDLPTHNHVASNITSGTLALSIGGLAANLSTTGGSFSVLRQTAAGAAITVNALAASEVGAADLLHQHPASDIVSGTLALARGGLAADISTTGGAGRVLKQTAAGAAVSVAVLATTDLPTHNHAASDINSGTLALARGGLAADISATGGTAQFLKQTSAGGAVSIGTIAATEVGTSGSASTSTFLRGDMTWAAPPGVSGGGTKTYASFTPLDNMPQTSDYATFDTRSSGVPVLDFDPTAVEAAVFCGLLPEGAVTTSGLKVRLAWTADTVTNTDAVVWGVQFQRIDTTTDLDADAFSNTVTATAAASGTAGVPVITEITLTGTAALDSLVAGDFYRIRISRDATAASDALTNDACLVAVEIRDAT